MKNIFLIILWLLTVSTVYAETPAEADARRRAIIERFLITYISAYENKDIHYIEQFFSDDALIITETNELLPTGNKQLVPNSIKNRPFLSMVEDKKHYLERLAAIFNKTNNLSISISGVSKIHRKDYPEIYGVGFWQIWNSEGQVENIEKMPGYIFLMIDFKNHESEPIIHVRTWQPRGNIEKPSDLYSLGDFRIIDFN